MPERGRVLLLLTGAFASGGIQRFNRTLLKACETLGLAADAYLLMDDEGCAVRAPPFARTRIVPFHGDRPRFAFAAGRAILSGEYGYVVVGHINLLLPAAAAALARPRSTTRLLLVAHGIEVWSGLGAVRRLALRRVERVLAVSEFTKGRIQAQAPELGDERFSSFPNALGASWADRAAMRRIALPQRAKRNLLAVSRLDRRERAKGLVTAIEAFAMLKDRDARFVIAGPGDDAEFLRGVARRHGVADRVRFAGAVSDAELARLYEACDVFLLPSAQEGFGIVFLEAMYFGAPVIAARQKGAVDVVRDGDTGILVSYGDAGGLRLAIERVLADETLRQGLIERARNTVVGDGPFAFDAFVRRCATVFDVQQMSSNCRTLALT